jgi:regulator of replication initiation timing
MYYVIEPMAVHTTAESKRLKALNKAASELEREVKALSKVPQMEPARKIRQEEIDRLKAEAEALKKAMRLEDLHVWQMDKEKSTKKGSKTYTYWMASWREGSRVRNVHLGSTRKMDAEAASLKARKLKAQALWLEE